MARVGERWCSLSQMVSCGPVLCGKVNEIPRGTWSERRGVKVGGCLAMQRQHVSEGGVGGVVRGLVREWDGVTEYLSHFMFPTVYTSLHLSVILVIILVMFMKFSLIDYYNALQTSMQNDSSIALGLSHR